MNTALLKDKQWASIEGRLCLVIDFVQMAKVEAGRITTLGAATPYASVRLRCEHSNDEITGFITHRTDFAMLWAAFKRRGQVPGGEDEEVWLVWSRKKYRFPASLLSLFMPKLVVMLSRKGALALLLNKQMRPDLTGEARYHAEAPLLTWTPNIMK